LYTSLKYPFIIFPLYNKTWLDFEYCPNLASFESLSAPFRAKALKAWYANNPTFKGGVNLKYISKGFSPDAVKKITYQLFDYQYIKLYRKQQKSPGKPELFSHHGT
jgi:hypothetical protein